jgi:hypothetical protein
MKRNSRFLVFLSAFVAVLFGGSAVAAFALFVLGTPWLAALNPYYALSDWSNEDTTVTEISSTIDDRGREATLLSAFFGVDGGLPPALRFFFCPFAPGNDGMPVIFSKELDVSSVQAGDFRVVTRAGRVGAVSCTTFLPASGEGELRTVLLAGEFGSAADQPDVVEIGGNVLSRDGSVNFRGAQVSVVPLEDGPSITLAKTVPEAEWHVGAKATSLPWGGGSGCPVGTRLAVRVTWEGGVTKPDGSDADDEDRQRYKVVFSEETGRREKVPTALADLGDGDNNHLLCFDVAGDPREVRFPAGFLTDPRDDLNPDTTASIGD